MPVKKYVMKISLLILFMTPSLQAFNKVYIWKFSTQDSKLEQYLDALTREFELALSQQKCVSLVTRRQLDRNLFHGQSEEGIQTISGISDEVTRALKTQEATGVIFGEVISDKVSGHIRIQVVLEDFSSEIIGMSRALINRGQIFDAETRESHMVNTATDLCKQLPKEFMNKGTPVIDDDLHEKSFGELTVTLKSCTRYRKGILIKISAISKVDANLSINGGDKRRGISRVIVNGEEVIGANVTLGASKTNLKSSSLSTRWGRTNLASGISVNGTLTFDIEPLDSRKVALIEIKGLFNKIEYSLKFQDVNIK